jgi:ABC-type Fe3+/spermidine/putrescine transport system ATPase subunit
VTGSHVEGLASSAGSFHLGPVSFPIAPGDLVAVLGPSGAGKTTMLRTLAGFQPASAGRATLEGVDLLALPPERRRVAYAPMLKGTDRSDPRLSELIERFGLGRFLDRRPTSLSSGEQQRVAIARALASRPQLLLWDEPLVALDLLARDDLIEALREVRQTEGLPIIIVTHDPAIAFSLADHFLLLDGGAALFSGTPEELQRAPPTPFAARFVGYENVYPASSLSSSSSGLAAWLRARSGPAGAALGPVAFGDDASGSGPWSGTVRRVEPSPSGWRCVADVDGTPVRLAMSADRPLRTGEPVRFTISEREVVALGGLPTERP